NLNAKIASIPMILTALVIFVGGTFWTVFYSFTNSKLLPLLSFVGFDQYQRLWAAPRWVTAIEMMTDGTVMRTEFQKPRDRPSQLRPVQACAHAFTQGSKVISTGGEKMLP
ncbi:hypothetical protein ACC740_36545, partial [Rhizobium ruizarguesonis]